MRITIEPYHPEWAEKFETEKQLFVDHLGCPDIRIEHIGSTAVQDLGAKLIIDIMIGIADFNQVDQLIGKLEKLGYQYISSFNELMPERRFFIKESGGIRTHHVHLVEFGQEFWIRHINFRDDLRQCRQDREDYYRLKLELSQREWTSGDEYASAKTDFIKMIERKAKAPSGPGCRAEELF